MAVRSPRIRTALTVAAAAYLVLRWVLLLMSEDPLLAADAYTYWSAAYDDPYPGPRIGLPGAYLYPPPFLQALAPLRLLPWEAFHAVWAAIGFASLIFLVGPIGGAIAITAVPFVFRDLLVGNIHLMIAAAVVLGVMRSPAWWAFPVLTKITPGIGLVWFVARGEWRSLAIAAGATTVIAGGSIAVAPDLWVGWIDRMRGDSNAAGGPYVLILGVRALLAAGLVFYAGRTQRSWLLPIAIVMSLPILWPDSLAILLACFPLMAARYLIRDLPESTVTAAR